MGDHRHMFTVMKARHMSSPSTAATLAPRRRLMAWAAACTALAMGLATVGAQAQPRHDPRHDHRDERRHDGRHDQHRDQRQNHRHEPHHRHDHVRPGGPHMHSHSGPSHHAHGPRPWRGAGPDHRWHRGDRLPSRYRSHHYVVSNWRAHRLSAPPRGYHWVQHGGDYLLVAIATGVIAQLILSR